MTSSDLAAYQNNLKSIRWYCHIQREHLRRLFALREGYPQSLIELQGSIVAVEYTLEKLENDKAWLNSD